MGGITTSLPERSVASWQLASRFFIFILCKTNTPSGARNHIIMLQYLLHTTARRINYVHLGVWNVPQKKTETIFMLANIEAF